MANRPEKQENIIKRLIRRCWQLLAIVVISFAILLASLRLFMPMLGQHANTGLELLSESVGRSLTAKQVKTSIQGFSPQIELLQVELLDDSGASAARIGRVYLELDLYQSIRDWTLKVTQLRIVDPVVVASKSEAGVWQIAGFEVATQDYGVDSRPRSSTFFAWVEILSGLQMDNVKIDCSSCDVALVDQLHLPAIHLSVQNGAIDLRGAIEWRDAQPRPLIVRANFSTFLPPDHSLVDTEFTRIDVSRDGRNWHTRGNVVVALDALVPTNAAGQFGHVDIGDTLRIASSVLGNSTLLKWVENLQPQGKLSNLVVNYSLAERGQGDSSLALTGDFAQLKVHRWNDIPGISGISGQFESDGRAVHVHLDSQSVSLDAPELFRNPLVIDDLAGNLSWQVTDSGWQLLLSKLRMLNADLSVSGSGAFDWFDDALRSPELALKLQIEDANGDRTRHYLPAGIMNSSLVEWLDYSIVSAHIPTAQLTLRGPLADFPFDQSDGEFQVTAKIEQGQLIPTEAMNWPAIENISGQLTFDRSHLSLIVETATTAGLPLKNVTATIDDLLADQTQIVIDGEATLDLPKHLGYIDSSPLKEILGSQLSVLSLAGDADLKLGLTIPFDERETQIDGKLKIKRAAVGVLDDTLLFNQVNGTLLFDQNGVRPSELSSRFLEYPTHIELESTVDGQGLSIQANGVFDVPSLRKAFDLPQLPIFEGRSEWLAKVRVEEKKTIVQLDSDLRGIALKMPAPLSKSADDVDNFRLKASIREGLATVRLSLDKHQARLELALSPQVSLNRGRVGIDKSVTALPKQGTFLIEVESPIIAAPWITWFEQLPEMVSEGSSTDALDVLIKFAELDFAGQVFKNTSIVWTPDRQENGKATEHWRALLDGPQVSGSVSYLEQLPNDLMIVELTRLHLTTPDNNGESETEATIPKKTAPTFPDIDLSIDNMVLDEQRLGALSLKLTQDERRDLHVDQLQLINEHTQLQAKLDSIHIDEGGVRSNIALTIISDNFGKALSSLGFEQTVNNGRGSAEINSQWPGSLSDFSLETMTGDFKVKFKEAIFPAIEPGIGRLFGVLSLETLTRRLTLDFGDLIGQGFTVDRIEGWGGFAQGVLSIDKLEIRGPAADIKLSGDTNMLTQQLYLDATVLPNITSSLPLAAALANPALGLAILFAQTTMGDEFAKITQMDYRIRGLWSDPSATEVK